MDYYGFSIIHNAENHLADQALACRHQSHGVDNFQGSPSLALPDPVCTGAYLLRL